MTRGYAVGIDLHGTLLDESWQIPQGLIGDLTAAMRSVQESCELFLCTGNDLTFLHGHMGNDFLSLFDGFVLETGCVVSFGSGEEVLVPPKPLSFMRYLERQLRDKTLPGVEYFARRQATISMFTKTEQGGRDPTFLYAQVKKTVEELGYADEVLVTHSDVAVDIIPAGFNKFTGLRHVATAPSLIGIADSLNDVHLIVDADCAFLPANVSPALLKALRDRGRDVEPLEKNSPFSNGTIVRSEHYNTEAVIDILHFLRDHLP